MVNLSKISDPHEWDASIGILDTLNLHKFEHPRTVIQVERLLSLARIPDKVILTDISHIEFPTWVTEWGFYQYLWELLVVSDHHLWGAYYRSNIWDKEKLRILQDLFRLHYSIFQKINDAAYTPEDQKYPYPKTLNSRVRPHTLKQLQRITKEPIWYYKWSRVSDLMWVAGMNQTFWEFCLTCFRSWIKLRP